ncbi:hypothetical protein HOT82_gp138 [Gordonia phage Ronaldo]|uniref:Uncharacterized protein n=2 Tax=Ronaldovirus ronaldo TaxID=2734270 RepID=A0A6B9LEL2_9CAUD|nr:hypothetical protein HOT82_gp138 [Gordonia phage Ronaldo]AXN53709.1 hypothetical protein SEA_RONALDO_137 [Gordonia phage Ronaldo]QHB38251.1 hypothetical protein SEA_VOLT_140 [Gordonia phage Volt]
MSELNDMLGMNEYPCGATNPDECTCYYDLKCPKCEHHPDSLTHQFDCVNCNHIGGYGIGSGHECKCTRVKGHELDSARPHSCGCGALWGELKAY